MTDRIPSVSIVMPTFNRARDVARCLDSLVAQTYRDFEVLVCDDGSTDNTGEIVARYQDRLQVSHHWAENFGGPARPRNIGVGLARGRYIAFLDSDDWWTPDKLERSVRALEGGADFVYHSLYFVRRADQKWFFTKTPARQLRKPAFNDLILIGNSINNSSVVVRSELMKKIGGFSEDRALIAAEDYDAWVRIARHTDAFVCLPKTLGYYWVGSGNLSNPRRTLTTLEALASKYATEFRDMGGGAGRCWLAYTQARAHYLLGQYPEARQKLDSFPWSRSPLPLRARAIVLRLLMRKRQPLAA